jgi:hypothetical protein
VLIRGHKANRYRLVSMKQPDYRLLKKLPGVRAVARQLRISPGCGGPRRFLLDFLPRRSVGAEIGVYAGDFSEGILHIVKPAKLELIDPWIYEASERYKDAWYGGKAQGGQEEMDRRYKAVLTRFHRQIRAGQISVHRGYSGEVCKKFPDSYFDWIYIDGNHLYEFVKDDLEGYYPKVKRSGYITGDDYKIGGWWESGVKAAVDEFVESVPVELVQIRNGRFILRKPG